MSIPQMATGSSSVSQWKLERNLDSKIPRDFFIVLAGLLAIASVLFIVRVGLVVWRHFKQPLYQDVSDEAMELSEIGAKQKKMYR